MDELQNASGDAINQDESVNDWLKRPEKPAYTSPSLGQDESVADWLSRGAKEEDPALTVSLNNGIKIPPEKAARVLKAQVGSGYSPDFIGRNLDYVEGEIKRHGFNLERLRAGSPATAQFLKEEPNRVGLFAADLRGLTDTEKLLSQAGDPDVMLRPFTEEEIKGQASRAAQRHVAAVDRFNLQVHGPSWPKKENSDALRQHFDDKIRNDEELIAKTAPLGFGSTLYEAHRENPLSELPFLHFGPSVSHALDLREAATALQEKRGDIADQELLTREWRKQIAGLRRGESTDGEVAKILTSLPAFIAELAATGGAAKAAESGIASGLVGGAAYESPGLIAKLGGIATQTALSQPFQIIETAVRRMTPEGQPEADKDGNFTYKIKSDTGEPAYVAIPKAAVDALINVGAAHVSFSPIYKLWAGKVAAPSVDGFIKTVAKGGIEGALSGISINEATKLAKAAAGIQPYELPTAENLKGQALVFGGLGGYHAGRARIIQDTMKVEADQFRITSVSDTVREMDAFKKAPEIVEQAIAAQVKDTKNEFVKLDPYEFAQYFQGKGINSDEFATALTGRPEALKDAMDHGTPLQIPTAAYVTKIGATEHGGFWQSKVLFDPMLRPPSEAQKHLAEVDAAMEAERKAAQQPKEQKPKEVGPGDVKDFASIQGKDVAAQAEAAGRPKQEASLIGKLVEAVYRTLGIRGSTPTEEMGQQHGPIIEKGAAGTLAQDQRAAYIPPDITKSQGLIRAFRDADPSSIPHELAHSFLEIISRDPRLAPMFEKFLKSRGIADAETWHKMTVDEKRPHHEVFATSYEDWLFKGEAPSKELRSVFFRYRELLNDVYAKQGKTAKDVSPEIRDIFERLHATDEEIQTAKERMGKLEPHLAKVKSLGMDPESTDRLAQLWADADLAATERLDKESLDEVNRQRSEEYKKLEVEAREMSSKHVDAQPDYIAKSIIETGALPDGTPVEWALGGVKFDGDNVTVQHSPFLPKQMISKEGGYAPDHLAEMLGYTSGDELIKKMSNLEIKEAVVQRLTKETMGKMRLDPIETLPAKAREAIHNDAEQKLNLYQAEWVAKNKLPELKEIGKRLANSKRYLQDVKEYADAKVGRGSYREADSRIYEAGERQAHKAAGEALASGDFKGFIAFVEREILNAELYRSSIKAREAADKIQVLMKETGATDYRSMMFKAGPQYLAQIDSLNERFSFRNASADKVERLKSLREFAESLSDDGYISQIPDKLLNEAYRTNWKDIPLEDLAAIGDTVANLEHLAKLKNELREGQKKRTLDETAADVVKSIVDNSAGALPKEVSTYRREVARAREWVSARLSIRNLSDTIRQMDGLKDGGALQQFILRRFNEAGANLAARNERATKELKRIFDAYTKTEQRDFSKKVYIPEIKNSLTREEMLMACATLGQEGAEQRFLDGRGWGPEAIEAIKNQLTEKDWAFIAELKKLINSDRAEVAKKMEQETGLPAKMAKEIPVETQFGEREGGYFPYKYDFRLPEAIDQAEVPELDEIKRSMRAAGLQSTTKHGFREARTQGVKLPVRLDFGIIYDHLTEKHHDLAYHQALREVSELLRHDKVKQAIFDHYGQQTYEDLWKNIRDIALGDKTAENSIERFFGSLRRGTVASSLGFNVMQFFTDLGGITQGMSRVGAKWVLMGGRELLGSPTKIKDTIEQMFADSELMRTRSLTRNRELYESKARIEEKGKLAQIADLGLDKVTGGKLDIADIHDFTYWLMSKSQMIQEAPVWLGAKIKAMHDFPADPAKGQDGYVEASKKWVSIADQAVLDAYGGGQIKDLSNLQKGGSIKKLVLATFYGFTNRTLNLMTESFLRERLLYKQGKKSFVEAAGKVAADTALLYMIPALYVTLVKAALSSGDEKKSLLTRVLEDQGSNAVSGIPVLREASPIIQERDYSGPAGLRFFSVLSQAGKKARHGDVPARELFQAGGILFHYPALQLQRIADGIEALSDGRTMNPTAPVFGAHGRR